MSSRSDPDSLLSLKSGCAVQLAFCRPYPGALQHWMSRPMLFECVCGHVDTLVVKEPCTHQPKGS